jgi:hypothetical protein
MRNAILIFILISLVSCSGNNNNRIPLYNELSFNLTEGESSTNISQKTEEKYTEYFNSGDIQMPLFKYIKHKDYEIFIGLPFQTSIAKMIQYQNSRSDSTVVNLKSNPEGYYKTYTSDSAYITEYATEVAGKYLLFISAVTTSKELADSLFTEQRLSSRITINN